MKQHIKRAFALVVIGGVGAFGLASCGGGSSGGGGGPQLAITPAAPAVTLRDPITANSVRIGTPAAAGPANANPTVGGGVSGAGRLRNEGTADATPTVEFLWSEDTTLDSGDAQAAPTQTLSISPGEEVSYSYSATAPTPPSSGIIYLCICIDGVCNYVAVMVTPPTSSPPAGGETGRTHPPLANCNDQVIFDEAGYVAFPSIDRVVIPAGSGTLRLDYNAFSVPDRFVVIVGGQRLIDTGYRGRASQSSDLLASAAQTGIITGPGAGTASAAKTSGATEAVVYVYAPLTGTEWNLTLTWDCGGSGGTGTYGVTASTEILECLSGSRGPNLAWVFASGYSTESAASSAALSICRGRASRGTCTSGQRYGSAYAAGNECAALAYGVGSIGCRIRFGTAGSRRAAESVALAECRADRQYGNTCWIPTTGSGQPASACSN